MAVDLHSDRTNWSGHMVGASIIPPRARLYLGRAEIRTSHKMGGGSAAGEKRTKYTGKLQKERPTSALPGGKSAQLSCHSNLGDDEAISFRRTETRGPVAALREERKCI